MKRYYCNHCKQFFDVEKLPLSPSNPEGTLRLDERDNWLFQCPLCNHQGHSNDFIEYVEVRIKR